ncbi:hypothetical protein ACU686_39395 [Yinghuangia aomiensis]
MSDEGALGAAIDAAIAAQGDAVAKIGAATSAPWARSSARS